MRHTRCHLTRTGSKHAPWLHGQSRPLAPGLPAVWHSAAVREDHSSSSRELSSRRSRIAEKKHQCVLPVKVASFQPKKHRKLSLSKSPRVACRTGVHSKSQELLEPPTGISELAWRFLLCSLQEVTDERAFLLQAFQLVRETKLATGAERVRASAPIGGQGINKSPDLEFKATGSNGHMGVRQMC